MAGPCALCGVAGGCPEGLGVADDVIRGHDQNDGLGIPPGGTEGSDRDGGSRILPARLQDNLGRDTTLRQLFRNDEAGVYMGDDDRPPESLFIAYAACRGLKGRRLLIHHSRELLRHAFPRNRPQACARAAA
ncbi:hypothetical protein MMMDOFMJ_3450 [Methylobacterium gnaphalii]|nr:hypothetical protein MMMDOFMJ_3450 [Methylobacterium gnaphalii]